MHQLRYHPGPAVGSAPSAPSRLPAAAPVPAPPRKRRSRAIAPLALAVVALLGGGAFAATRSRAGDAPTQAELQAAVHRAAFTSADFPGGWTADPPDPADDTSAEDRALAECMGATYEHSPTEAQSSFSSPGLSAASEFTIASSVERARADFAALAGPAAPGCFEQMFRKALEADKPADASYDVKVTPNDLTAGLLRDADHDAVGLGVTATFHQGKTSVPITFGVVMIRDDRIEAMLTFTSLARPFPADLARTLSGAVGHRLADNPA